MLINIGTFCKVASGGGPGVITCPFPLAADVTSVPGFSQAILSNSNQTATSAAIVSDALWGAAPEGFLTGTGQMIDATTGIRTFGLSVDLMPLAAISEGVLAVGIQCYSTLSPGTIAVGLSVSCSDGSYNVTSYVNNAAAQDVNIGSTKPDALYFALDAANSKVYFAFEIGGVITSITRQTYTPQAIIPIINLQSASASGAVLGQILRATFVTSAAALPSLKAGATDDCGTAIAAPSWSLTDLFSSGQTGFVLSGFPGGSAIYETDGKAALASAAGSDPVGAIADVSGNGNDVIQTVSANRLVYNVDVGGVRSWRKGGISGQQRFLTPETDVFVSADMCVVSVYKYLTPDDNFAVIVSGFDGAWGGDGYFFMAAPNTSPNNKVQICAHTTVTPQEVVGAELDAGAAIVRWDRAGTGSNESVLTTYQQNGTQIATSTGTQNASPIKKVFVGYGTSAIFSGEIEECFLLVRNQKLTAGEWTSLAAFLTEKLSGGW